MSDELLVRVYKVGCGDCIFVRIPDKERPYHLLIDCGNFFLKNDPDDLKPALEDVKSLLNEEIVPVSHRGHLDLLVATHEHYDHMVGFDSSADIFKTIEVDRVWLPVAMKPDHPEAHQFRAFQAEVQKAINRFVNDRELNLNPSLRSALEMMSASKEEAITALTKDIPDNSGIQPSYVYRGFEGDLSEQDAGKTLLDFKDPETKLSVLAPENEIDKSYLGHGFGVLQDLGEEEGAYALVPKDQRIDLPANISMREFRELKNELQYASLLAASQSGEVVNNTSVVLLLEWKGRRLLFPGDAEQKSWKLMWKNAKTQLQSVDFLKVAHHGSCTGTPNDLKGSKSSTKNILESVLPVGNAKIAQAVVSTEAGVIRAANNPVPNLKIMNEIARRVRNVKEYPSELGKQPLRTDKEKGAWIDITIAPKTS